MKSYPRRRFLQLAVLPLVIPLAPVLGGGDMEGPNAVLNTMTLPPGALPTQPRLVIDGIRGAIFMYGSGGPLGALVGSWARTAGTDPYGNAYPQGFSLAGSGVGQTFLFYNPAPGANQLALSINPSSAVFTDAFGNIVLSGFTVYTPLFSGKFYAVNVGVIQASPLILGVEVWQSTAASQSAWTGSAIFQWVQATNRVALNQPLQLASYVIIPEQSAPAAIASNVIIYVDTNGVLQLVPPAGTARVALLDFLELAQQSAGPTVASGFNALWTDTSDIVHVSDSFGADARMKLLEAIFPNQSSAPAAIASNDVVYADSGNSLHVKRASGLDGTLPAHQIDISTHSIGNVATAADITKTWSIPADGNVGTIYEIETFVSFTMGATATETLTIGVDISGTLTALATLGQTFNSSLLSGVYDLPIRLRVVVDAIALNTPHVTLQGEIAQTSANRLATNSANMSGHSNATTFNKAIANTLAVWAQWGGAGGTGQNVQTLYSELIRKGA